MRLCVYTAIANYYDNLKPQLSFNCDFIAWTDKIINDKIWKTQQIEWDNDDPNRVAKKYKVNSHLFVTNYDYSLWIDGSIICNIDPNILINYMGDNDMIVHKKKGNILLEASIVMRRILDSPKIVYQQINRYKNDNFPLDEPVFECSVLLRKNNNKTIDFNELWWKEICNGSRRDQISASYAAKKVGLKVGYFPGDAKQYQPNHNGFFSFSSHNGNHKWKKKQ